MTTKETWFFQEQGTGPPLVLLHGLGASSFSWRHNISPLAEHYRVLAPDLPVHGFTPAATVADYRLETLAEGVLAFLDRQGIDQAALVGNSLGGSLALLLAHDQPERISALALLAPAAALTRSPVIFRPLRLPGFGLLFAACLGPWILPFALRLIYFRQDLITPEVIKGYRPTFKSLANRLAFRRLARQLGPRPLPQVEALVRETRQPAVIIWGAEDRILPVQQAAWLKPRFPQAELHILPEVGHAPQEEAPEAVNKIIIAFLKRSLKN